MKKYIRYLLSAQFQLSTFVVLAFAIQFIVWQVSPENAMIVLYKIGLATLAAIIGFLLDLCLFPYAKPVSYLTEDWKNNPNADNPGYADYPIVNGYHGAFIAASLRRSLIISAFILGISLGL